MRILIVEDDRGISAMIRRGLEQAGYVVDSAADGARGLNMALARPYSAIVLDIMLPGMDGWTVCQELRTRRNQTPILMLTARDEVQDRIKGLDAGADDYLPKPFDFRELMARVRSLVRRDKVHKSRIIRIADLEIDSAKRKVTRAGQEVGLSNREYELLEALAAHEGQVLTREAIQARVWMDEDSFSNTVDVYIAMLRKKIDRDHPVKLIQTVRGVGYSLRAQEEK